jgi:metal-dependent amidase/aminoacylase/carboxypeptidase family protein
MSNIQTYLVLRMIDVFTWQVEVGLVGQPFSAVLHNKVMAGLYQSNLATLQTDDVPTVKSAVLGSTDMGNVSQIVPSIHPSFYIGGRAVNHTREFTKEAGEDLELILI